MTLERYKALLDARYRGESVALTAAEQKRIDRRSRVERSDDDLEAPRWLLVRPDGQIDGCHVFSRRWSDEASVWRGFFPRKRERDALIRDGWTVRRDDTEHSGFAAFLAQPLPTATAADQQETP